eukprot:5589862-Ditylum_brightwellii.AAC.1
MPRKGSCNCFHCHACKQKHVYKNKKLGCDSRDDIEEVIRENNGVGMGDNVEKENNNKQESESEEEEEEKNEGFEVEEMKEQQEEEG